MKSLLNLKAKAGDNRTLNRYVLNGALEVKSFSRKVKMYREVNDNQNKKQEVEEWVF